MKKNENVYFEICKRPFLYGRYEMSEKFLEKTGIKFYDEMDAIRYCSGKEPEYTYIRVVGKISNNESGPERA